MPTLGKSPFWESKGIGMFCRIPGATECISSRGSPEPRSSGTGSYSQNDQSSVGNEELALKARMPSFTSGGCGPQAKCLPPLHFMKERGHKRRTGKPFYSLSVIEQVQSRFFLKALKSQRLHSIQSEQQDSPVRSIAACPKSRRKDTAL